MITNQAIDLLKKRLANIDKTRNQNKEIIELEYKQSLTDAANRRIAALSELENEEITKERNSIINALKALGEPIVVDKPISIETEYSVNLNFRKKVLFALKQITTGNFEAIEKKLKELEPDLEPVNLNQCLSNLLGKGYVKADTSRRPYMYSTLN